MSIPIRWQMQELIDEHRPGRGQTTDTPICDACKILSRGSSITHGHQHFMLTLITRGSGIQSLNGKEIPFEAHHLFLLSPADFHCNTVTDGETFDYYRLCFSYELLESRLSGLFPLDALPLHLKLSANSAQLAEGILSRLTEESENTHHIGHREYLQALVEQLLILVLREAPVSQASQPGSPINRALGFLYAHFQEDIRVQDAATVAGYTPNYFNFCFREQVGMPFGEYLRQMRLNYAENLLRSSVISVSEIAFDAGFGSLSHFSRSFRQKHGCAPQEYRRRMLAE